MQERLGCLITLGNHMCSFHPPSQTNLSPSGREADLQLGSRPHSVPKADGAGQMT